VNQENEINQISEFIVNSNDELIQLVNNENYEAAGLLKEQVQKTLEFFADKLTNYYRLETIEDRNEVYQFCLDGLVKENDYIFNQFLNKR